MKLWIIRHAKSSWTDHSQSDFDRPLNKRGLRDGPRMQNWLAQQSHLPEWVYVSDSRRTQETCEFLSEALSPSAQIFFEHRLYLPNVNTMLELIAQCPADINNLALISHNPASTYLVNLLADELVIDNLPTLGIARFEVKSDWNLISAERCKLDLIVSPKSL